MTQPRQVPVDEDRRVVEPFRLPEHMRREPPPMAPQQQYEPQQRQRSSYMNDLEHALRLDPLKQIAATVVSLRFEDMLILAKEICSLETLEPPANSTKPPEEPQIIEFRFALKMHTWAKSKFAPPPPPDE